jgi:choline dehydrogenase-like flavoprotein
MPSELNEKKRYDFIVQPTSKGSVRLSSSNFRDAGVIHGNYLGTDHDFAAVVRAIEAARELGSQCAFDNLRASSFPVQRPRRRIFENSPGLPQRALDTPLVPAKLG